jgi:mono/diheme cytochrome c family protein
MARYIILLLAGVGVTLLPGDSPRAGCRSVVAVHHQKQAAVVFAQQYAQPYYYSVGAPLQYAAMKEQIKAELRAEAQQLSAAERREAPPSAVETLPITAPESHSIIKDKCIGCHGTNQKAMDALPAEQFLAHLTGSEIEDYQARERMMVRMLDGSMPPKGPLPGDVLGNALGQIVGAETAP